MTSTNTDILGERTALERMIYDLHCQISTRIDEGAEHIDALGPLGLTIGGAQERVRYLENLLATYKRLEDNAKQYKNPPDQSDAYGRSLISAKILRSAREILLNIIHLTPHESALLKAAMMLLDSAVEELERND